MCSEQARRTAMRLLLGRIFFCHLVGIFWSVHLSARATSMQFANLRGKEGQHQDNCPRLKAPSYLGRPRNARVCDFEYVSGRIQYISYSHYLHSPVQLPPRKNMHAWCLLCSVKESTRGIYPTICFLKSRVMLFSKKRERERTRDQVSWCTHGPASQLVHACRC